MTVVGVAETGDAAIRAAEALTPDVVLMDIEMPGLCPFAATSSIQSQPPTARVLMLSAFSQDAYIEQALKAKAWGYVTKAEHYDAVRTAIRDVHAGMVHFAPDIAARIINGPDGPGLAPDARTRANALTPRETEVLRYLARGLSTRDIADTMNISVKTVNSHKTNLMAKLGIHDRVDLARYAFREGIATP
jgi:DNA-binding NarL/FixJ family response regulator